METTNKPISVAEVHAYTDAQLTESQAINVEERFVREPGRSEEIRDYLLINDKLHKRFDYLIEEKIPDHILDALYSGKASGYLQSHTGNSLSRSRNLFSLESTAGMEWWYSLRESMSYYSSRWLPNAYLEQLKNVWKGKEAENDEPAPLNLTAPPAPASHTGPKSAQTDAHIDVRKDEVPVIKDEMPVHKKEIPVVVPAGDIVGNSAAPEPPYTEKPEAIESQVFPNVELTAASEQAPAELHVGEHDAVSEPETVTIIELGPLPEAIETVEALGQPDATAEIQFAESVLPADPNSTPTDNNVIDLDDDSVKNEAHAQEFEAPLGSEITIGAQETEVQAETETEVQAETETEVQAETETEVPVETVQAEAAVQAEAEAPPGTRQDPLGPTEPVEIPVEVVREDQKRGAKADNTGEKSPYAVLLEPRRIVLPVAAEHIRRRQEERAYRDAEVIDHSNNIFDSVGKAVMWLGKSFSQAALDLWQALRATQLVPAITFTAAGLILGWILSGGADQMKTGGSNLQLERLVLNAHQFYAKNDRSLIETAGQRYQNLISWLAKRLGKNLQSNDLTEIGFKRVGSILLPTEEQFALYSIYENSKKQKISVIITAATMSSKSKQCVQTSQAIPVCLSVNEGLSYAVASDLSLKETRHLADIIQYHF